MKSILLYISTHPELSRDLKLIGIYTVTLVGGFTLSEIDLILSLGLKLTSFITFSLFIVINVKKIVEGLKYLFRR